jgi:hypothetical protein
MLCGHLKQSFVDAVWASVAALKVIACEMNKHIFEFKTKRHALANVHERS